MAGARLASPAPAPPPWTVHPLLSSLPGGLSKGATHTLAPPGIPQSSRRVAGELLPHSGGLRAAGHGERGPSPGVGAVQRPIVE